MARKKPDFDATKTEHYRSYTVREHERKMYERVYKFVCIGCERVVERKSYAVCCPSYGNECNGKTSVCRRIISHETPLSGYTLTPLPEELQPQVAPSKAKSKVKKKVDDGAASLENRPYSGRQMMKRLKCGERLLRIKRSQPDFSEWSQQRDPEGIAWQYQDGQFVPLEVSQVDTAPVQEEAQPKPFSSKSKTKQKQKTTNKTKKASVAKAPSLENRPYSGRQMMKRLKCGERLLRIKRSQPDFSEWSQQRDPEGIAWQYQDGQFVPLEVSQVDTAPVQEEAQPKPSSTKSKTKQKQKTTNKTKKTSVTQAPSLESKPLSGRQMMKRLKCGERLLRIKRSQPDFKEWSQERDPDGVAWKYTKGQFVPLKVAQVDTAPVQEEAQPKPSSTKSKTKPKQKTTQKTKKTSVAQAPALESKPLSGRQMMKRLKCGDRLLRIKRSQPNFAEWSQKRDPEGVAWQYKGDQFVPLEVSTLDSEPEKVESPPKPSSTKSKTKQKQKTVRQKTTKKNKSKADTPTTSLENRAYTVRQVMERFHCGDRLLRIKRDQPDFSEWSQQRDPDGIAWKYKKGQFVPQIG